jgi:hypothetical protein
LGDDFRRIFGALVFTGAVLSLGACAAAPNASKVDAFAQQVARPLYVPRSEVTAAAERAAAQHEGDFVLEGAGRSMEPVYFAGTALVVHPTAVHMLRAGMPVVYRNRQGVYVAHVLVEKTARGWRTAGLNNPEPDEGWVTAANLVGIVRQAFAADPLAGALGSPVAINDPRRGGASMTLVH